MATQTTKPIISIFDTKTGKQIDREMTNEEFAQFQLDKEEYELQKQQSEAKRNARLALLEKLGLTEEEAKLLLS